MLSLTHRRLSAVTTFLSEVSKAPYPGGKQVDGNLLESSSRLHQNDHRAVPGSSSAYFSLCGDYRYMLMRRLGTGTRTVLFIGLNPSTADACEDDPTIRRCAGFARRMGYDVLLMANLFAWCSTDPRLLKKVHDPVGPQNDYWLQRLATAADTTIAAWGNGAVGSNRPEKVLNCIQPLYCLGRTNLGYPRHPLYLSGNTRLVLFN